MSDPDVRELFLRAVTHNDSAAMREGIERLFGLTGDGLSPEAEYRLRHEDYVMETPQSGERDSAGPLRSRGTGAPPGSRGSDLCGCSR